MTDLIDVSVPIRERMPVYPGNPAVRIELVQSIAAGADANVSRIELGAHTGTHVDAPGHFLAGGGDTQAIALPVLVGPARVVDATSVDGDLDADALAGLDLGDAARVLFRTRNSELWGRDEFAEAQVRLTGDGARRLLERGAVLVGMDHLSVGDRSAHHALLEAGTAVLEGLDLRGVEGGDYELICLPLRLVGSDGAPARALLRRA